MFLDSTLGLIPLWQATHPKCSPSRGSTQEDSVQPGWASVSPCGSQVSTGHVHSKNSKTTTEPRIYFCVPLTGEECVTFQQSREFMLPKPTIWLGSLRKVLTTETKTTEESLKTAVCWTEPKKMAKHVMCIIPSCAPKNGRKRRGNMKYSQDHKI